MRRIRRRSGRTCPGAPDAGSGELLTMEKPAIRPNSAGGNPTEVPPCRRRQAMPVGDAPEGQPSAVRLPCRRSISTKMGRLGRRFQSRWWRSECKRPAEISRQVCPRCSASVRSPPQRTAVSAVRGRPTPPPRCDRSSDHRRRNGERHPRYVHASGHVISGPTKSIDRAWSSGHFKLSSRQSSRFKWTSSE